jgi:hypothetical protein
MPHLRFHGARSSSWSFPSKGYIKACLLMQSSPLLSVQLLLNSDAIWTKVDWPLLTGRVLAAGHTETSPPEMRPAVHFSHDIVFSACVPSQLPSTYSPAVHTAEHGRHPGIESSRPVVHCWVEDCCVLRYCPCVQLEVWEGTSGFGRSSVQHTHTHTRQITNLHGSHPLRGNVTILFPGLQKQPSSDVASTSVSVMPPPLHAAHCT